MATPESQVCDSAQLEKGGGEGPLVGKGREGRLGEPGVAGAAPRVRPAGLRVGGGVGGVGAGLLSLQLMISE